MIQNYINHIALVADRSGSMAHLQDTVVKVFDSEIDYLRTRSKELNQETRISVYTFNDRVECLVFDMDVYRMPSLKGYYRTDGQTALMDAAAKAVDDMSVLPQTYGDHAFLVYLFTDGQENNSRQMTSSLLKKKLDTLPDNWTIACMVPDARSISEAKKFGFPAQNVQVWSTDSKGVESMGKSFRVAMDSYFDGRSKGVRGTKNLFNLDASNLTKTAVTSSCKPLSANDYTILQVRKDSVIKEFVESWKIPYTIGGSYYELVKAETIQPSKMVCIQDRLKGTVFQGDEARNLLGLSGGGSLRVKPVDHGGWRIFVQSTSVNRKLPEGTQLLVMK